MAGTANDASGVKPGGVLRLALSSTVNECDTITGIPSWVEHVSYHAVSSAARVAGIQTHSSKTTASTLVDTEEHKPLPAGQWITEPYSGGPNTGTGLLVSGAASAVVYVAFYDRAP